MVLHFFYTYSAYFYDLIVNRKELSFSNLIEMYMTEHQIKRGIITT